MFKEEGEFLTYFTAELGLGTKNRDLLHGNIEIHSEEYPYPIYKISVATNKPKEFNEFLNKFDFKVLPMKKIQEIEEEVKSKYKII